MDSDTGHSEHFDKRLRHILDCATLVFASKGYHQASIRDISRKTGISLSGLYYYFDTKEELLFLIIQKAFEIALSRSERLVQEHRDLNRVRFFIRNHLETFVANLSVAKVMVHETEFLTGDFRARVEKLQRAYFDILVEILADPSLCGRTDPKIGALTLLGMMNWIYTWYDPGRDQSTTAVAESMAAIFLKGYVQES